MSFSLQQERELAGAMHLLMPLHFFYAQDERMLPAIEFVPPSALPANERELLVHDHDMTSTLIAYHQSPVDLQVVRREMSASYLLRLVVLTRRELPVPVEFGAIGIHLDPFEPALRAEIEEGRKPLGGLWGRCNTLSMPDGEVFADIVEILPPALRAVPATVHRRPLS